VETEESRRRREQSDEASAAIGQRLLKVDEGSNGFGSIIQHFWDLFQGWAMLADECPNARCFGVPLVRPPKAGGEKDPRKVPSMCFLLFRG
jgi:hypothetical protein